MIEKLIAQIGSKYDGIHCFREKERGRGIETESILKDCYIFARTILGRATSNRTINNK